MSGLKDLILAADDLPFEDKEVPEWGGVTVRVQGMTGTDRDAYEARALSIRKGAKSAQEVDMKLANFRARLLVKCLFDPKTKERVFDDNDAPKLGAKAGLVIDRLFDLATRLSGMTEGSEEEARGNSGAAPSGVSIIA